MESSLDPRLAVIPKRLSSVKRVVAVASGKGGVGKTLIASVSALILAKHGVKVGLLDLDFHGPSCHVVLGAKILPKEEKGLIPVDVEGVKLMSVGFYAGGEPIPIRGGDIVNIMREVLATTIWGDLDILLVDTPPGTGDELLEFLRLVDKCELMVVTTPSQLALKTVERLIKLVREEKRPIIGVIENFKWKEVTEVEEWCKKMSVRYLGYLPFDPWIDECVGQPKKILNSVFAEYLEKIILSALKPEQSAASV